MEVAILDEEYYCESCKIYCSNKFNYNKHLNTKKHKRGGLQVAYYCALCDYGTTRKNDYTKHLSSFGHVNKLTCSNVGMPSKDELNMLIKKRVTLNKIQKKLEKDYDKYALAYKNKYQKGGIQFGITKKQTDMYNNMSAKLDEFDKAYMEFDIHQELLNKIGDEILKKLTPIIMLKYMQSWKNNMISPKLAMDGKYAVLNFK